MGHYTRIKLEVSIGADAPGEVIDILKWLATRREAPHPDLPDHPLFQCAHWESLGFGSASYWDTQPPPPTFALTSTGDWLLTFECALRNYDDEIEKFFDWIGPHLASPTGQVIGEIETEEQRFEHRPTLLIAQAGAIAELHQPAPVNDFWGFGGA